MSDSSGGFALDQPVGADDVFRTLAETVIDDQQMIGDSVVDIAVSSRRHGCVIRACAHLLIKHPVAQRLNGIDLSRSGGDPDT